MAQTADFKLSSNAGGAYGAVNGPFSGSTALAYVAAGTYSIKAQLDSVSGLGSCSWSITSADDLHNASLPTVTTASDQASCTFSVPKTGGAWLLRAIVNGGVNLQTGATDTTLIRTLKIAVLNAINNEEIALGETYEGDPVFGYTGVFNRAIRTGGAGVLAGDVTGPAGGNTVVKIQGRAVAATAPTDTFALVWNASGSTWQPGAVSATSPTGTGIPHVIAGVTQAASSLIVDADVNAAAAVAGTKIAPDFGSAQVVKAGGVRGSLSPFKLSEQAISYASDADKTLTSSEYDAHELILTSVGNMTGSKKLVLPITSGGQWLIKCGISTVTGATIQAIGATGTGITMVVGSWYWVRADGTNIVNVGGGAAFTAPTGTGLMKVTAGAMDVASSLLLNADITSATVGIDKIAVGVEGQSITCRGGTTPIYSENASTLLATGTVSLVHVVGTYDSGALYTTPASTNCVIEEVVLVLTTAQTGATSSSAITVGTTAGASDILTTWTVTTATTVDTQRGNDPTTLGTAMDPTQSYRLLVAKAATKAVHLRQVLSTATTTAGVVTYYVYGRMMR